ncbi:class I SAM-dependent methyltransferase [Okeania sp. KiyG1]|uniref:methyltransferase domain-containing protein n=1 Tax=Okeania sp. KiyG1 TaxID=2720165 RepID=UPI0019C0E769|nr:class I SAM-dependent methyltransferase [Okeania sp. KiyG1]GGA07792.1 hypothetical protein CYANOKiyG1_20230 [Okeania sp. KiyG1]
MTNHEIFSSLGRLDMARRPRHPTLREAALRPLFIPLKGETLYHNFSVKGFFYGIDMSPGMLESAKSKGLYKELKQSILPEIPYADNTFDIVISA